MIRVADFKMPLGNGQFYEPWQSGLRALAQSKEMGEVTLKAARDIAGTAGSAGFSQYDAAPYTVVSGRRNESRAGAVAFESERDWRDARDEVLKRTAAAMGRRPS